MEWLSRNHEETVALCGIVTAFGEGIAVAADTVNFTVTETGIGLEPAPRLGLCASPNPFYSVASISFELSEPGYTSIKVFDLAGRIVCSLAESELGAGQYSYIWNGRSVRVESLLLPDCTYAGYSLVRFQRQRACVC